MKRIRTCLIDAGIFIEDDTWLDELRKVSDVDVHMGIPSDLEDVIRRAGDAQIIAFGMMTLTNEMLDALPSLRIIQFIGTGVSNFVDMEYANSKGIKIFNIEGYGNNAVAEFAISTAMSLIKRLPEADRRLKSGQWELDGLLGREISSTVFGVYGTGNIGAEVARIASRLGAQVIACDLYKNQDLCDSYGVTYVTPHELTTRSDILSIHLKATPETAKMIDGSIFETMKENAIFINVARAELVDYEALHEALVNHSIDSAAIDVYYNEPPSPIEYELAGLKNVLATPHIAYYTAEANRKSIDMTVQSILKAIDDNKMLGD